MSNLPFSLEEEALESAIREILNALGKVESLRLVFEGSTIRPKGLCFAEMSNEEGAALAISTLNGLHVAGHTLHASDATPHLVPSVASDSFEGEGAEAEELHGWPAETTFGGQ